jgi:hypothetical protein
LVFLFSRRVRGRKRYVAVVLEAGNREEKRREEKGRGRGRGLGLGLGGREYVLVLFFVE